MEEEIYMFEKTAEKIIWFEAESPPGQFTQDIILRRKQLKRIIFRFRIRICGIFPETVNA
ncbi:hypothetical protein J11TS1_37850 [Oceanobacillus sp. J11TS1]|nr:hypothetical protein J11TS1_37850 [Oceanobacillus sp. J11TS1]